MDSPLTISEIISQIKCISPQIIP
ncbi:hypothetical protein JMJ77_0003755, partial [Colletotrichum scovillei]